MAEATLRSIELDDIQLLRYWRNLDHVRSRMVMTNQITRDGQRKWFESLSPDLAHYYIFSLDHRDVGCVNLTKINYDKKTFEGGVFCGDSDFLNHWINIWACVKIYNRAFFELDMERSFATILKNNKPALSLNQSLGYEFVEDTEENIGRFVLTRDAYIRASEKVQRYLRSFAKQSL